MANENRKGRPLKKESDKLNKRIRINLNHEEFKAVMKDFDESEYQSRSQYIRARVLDKEIRTRSVHSNLVQLENALTDSNEELHKIGVNMNQIARHLNTYKSPAHRTEILALLKGFIKMQKTVAVIQDTIHDIHTKW